MSKVEGASAALAGCTGCLGVGCGTVIMYAAVIFGVVAGICAIVKHFFF